MGKPGRGALGAGLIHSPVVKSTFSTDGVVMQSSTLAVENNYPAASLVTSWAGFIDGLQDENNGFEWNWFGTWTFRDKQDDGYGNKHHVHPEAAMKAIQQYIHILNRKSYGVRYTKDKRKGVVWALSTEYQTRGAIHYHGLIGCVPDHVRRMDFVDLWWQKNGMARIFKYENKKGAEQYLAKNSYAWKKGEIDLGGPLTSRCTRYKGGLSF